MQDGASFNILAIKEQIEKAIAARSVPASEKLLVSLYSGGAGLGDRLA
jgi:hypothetical protein